MADFSPLNRTAPPVIASRRTLLQAGALSLGTGIFGLLGPGVATAEDQDYAVAADGRPATNGAPSRAVALAAAAPSSNTSYNGWPVGTPASSINVQSFVVPRTSIILPIKYGDVATVLLYVAQRFNAEVEQLQGGQCWGYSYRANVNNPSVWSNHASGTAIDLNSAIHPNGARYTYTAGQTDAVRRILDFCNGVVYWGQDYSGTVDGMHFEIDVDPSDPALPALAAKIRAGGGWSTGLAGYADGSGSLHVFGLSKQGWVTELSDSSGSWRSSLVGGGPIIGTPAVTYRNGRADLFVIGGDNALWAQTRVGSSWSGWYRIGGQNLISGLGAIVDPGGSFHVVGVTTAGQLVQFLGVGSSWYLQDLSNGNWVSGVPAITYHNGQYDFYANGYDGMVWQQSWASGYGWSPWGRVAAVYLVGGLRAIYDSQGYSRVFGVSKYYQTIQAYSRGNGWGFYDATNGVGRAGVPAIIENGNRLEVFALGSEQAAWQETSVDNQPFGAWKLAGGEFM